MSFIFALILSSTSFRELGTCLREKRLAHTALVKEGTRYLPHHIRYSLETTVKKHQCELLFVPLPPILGGAIMFRVSRRSHKIISITRYD